MLNKQVQYAVHLLNSLNETPGSNLRTVSAEKNLSLCFLEQVSRQMRVAGFLVSKRGPGGGYSLARKDIRLGELLRIFQPKALEATDSEITNRISDQVSKLLVFKK